MKTKLEESINNFIEKKDVESAINITEAFLNGHVIIGGRKNINKSAIEVLIQKYKNQKIELEQKNKVIEFCNKNLTEQVRILLAKYWLTHTNDEVFETFGCNYVPNIEYQNKAREIKDILELELHKKINLNTLSKFEIKAIMGGATSYPIK